jgi:hypothetical protein
MKRALAGLVVVALVMMYANVYAADQTKSATKEAPKLQTITGEVVDMGCYLSKGERGASHKGCAQMCINNGMPMGLLTNEGKLYLLTLSHDNADPYNAVKKMAAEQVSITGPVSDRDGIMSLTVQEVKQVSGATPEKQG